MYVKEKYLHKTRPGRTGNARYDNLLSKNWRDYTFLVRAGTSGSGGNISLSKDTNICVPTKYKFKNVRFRLEIAEPPHIPPIIDNMSPTEVARFMRNQTRNEILEFKKKIMDELNRIAKDEEYDVVRGLAKAKKIVRETDV